MEHLYFSLKHFHLDDMHIDTSAIHFAVNSFIKQHTKERCDDDDDDDDS